MKRRKCLALTTAFHVAMICAAAMISSAAYAVKGHCEGDTHWQCTIYLASKGGGAWYDPKTGQWYNKSCGCEANSGGTSAGSSSGGSYGHAEIHKRNVPTVKPSGVDPGNLARPPLGVVAPRAPAPTFQPGRSF